MIKRIKINNFGSFSSFAWPAQLGEFKKLNIFFGRNYSGKTTLSKLVRSLQTKVLPDNYDNPLFEVIADSGVYSQAQVSAFPDEVRVFNSDYIKTHLRFFNDDNGNVVPFAVVGGTNVNVLQSIAQLEARLDDSTLGTGLRTRHSQKHAEWDTKRAALKSFQDDRTSRLTNKANRDIKPNRQFGTPNYNIVKIESDIATVRRDDYASPSATNISEAIAILTQEPMAAVHEVSVFLGKCSALITGTNDLLTRVIRPNQPIQELLNDAVLQQWVRNGIDIHRNKRPSCGFCGGEIPHHVWQKLDAHFSKETQLFDSDLASMIADIAQERNRLVSLRLPKKETFYRSLHPEFEQLDAGTSQATAEYLRVLEELTLNLEKRRSDPFATMEPVDLTDPSGDINEVISSFGRLILRHNSQTSSLGTDQEQARISLRLDAVAKFIQDAQLDALEQDIAIYREEEEKLRLERTELETEVQTIEEQIQTLRLSLRDERKGAAKVNELLNHYFGHGGLTLVAVEDPAGVVTIFQVQRGARLAYNLSDGERSLLAFCYFMARLSDDETEGKELIVFIDDPISSLDSNHIFFMFGLIESLIARPVQTSPVKLYGYKQLFISTHNLDFLKYLKRLSKPKNDHEQFLIMQKSSGSCIELMPKYLKVYVTEFHFLFDEIYACLDPNNAGPSHHCFYNFGNNLRKFMEIYLFFRYPFASDDSDHNKRLEMFFNDEPAVEPMITRVTNELSH